MHEGTPGSAIEDAPQANTSAAPQPARTLWPVVIGVVVLFAVLVVVLWRTGVFDKDTSKSDAQIVAAMVTLLGGLIASAFTLVGVLLKHSIDLHNARLAEDMERTRRLEAAEVEARLRLETSIKAVELMTLPDGNPSPSIRQAGALFVLGSEPLAQLDLALALLDENWEAGAISPSAAVSIIDRALTQPDPNLQTKAALTLQRHAAKAVSLYDNGMYPAWPDHANMQWPMNVSFDARIALYQALAVLVAESTPNQWRKEAINWFIVEFDAIREAEDNPNLARGATLMLDVLFNWYPRDRMHQAIYTPKGHLHLDALRLSVAADREAAELAVGEQVLRAVMRLREKWGYPRHRDDDESQAGRLTPGAREDHGRDV